MLISITATQSLPAPALSAKRRCRNVTSTCIELTKTGKRQCIRGNLVPLFHHSAMPNACVKDSQCGVEELPISVDMDRAKPAVHSHADFLASGS